MDVRTRFAPSPTGVLHLGSVRTALYAWLFARHKGGRFVLRIEDTDRQRSTAENVQAILDGMDWLGLDADEGPLFQTERFDRYRQVADEWLDRGDAYYCYCTREELDERREAQRQAGARVGYDGRCRERTEPRPGVDPVVRFRNPSDGVVIVEDAVRGRVEFRNAQLDDLIILRSDGTPTYNFTVVVDDCDMKISHVIRGDDHLNNTPRQMNMLAVMGAPPIVYCHLPMILGPDGAKLSKRHGAVDIRQYREDGYLPGAVLNYLVRLGWSHGDREVFTVDEMIRLFDIGDINQSASSFNPDKLRWLNQQHIKAAPSSDLGGALGPFLARAGLDVTAGPDPRDTADALRERADTLREMADAARYFYEDFDAIDPKAAKRHLRPVVLEPFAAVCERLAGLDAWSDSAIQAAIAEVAEDHELGFGKLGQPIRVAVTGGSVSPPIDVTLRLIGKDRSLARLGSALELIRERAAAG